MYGLPSTTLSHSMYLSANEKTIQQHQHNRFHPNKPMKKCSFDIDSILKSTINTSYADDTEDSSDDGHIHLEPSSSFCTSPISSYALVNQLKTNDNLASSSFESEHSPNRSVDSTNISKSKSHHGFNPKSQSKRIRTIFTTEQIEKLEAEFNKQQYMVGNERLYLATSLHLTEAQVKIWFQNRRIKWRRQVLDNHQQ